MVSSHYFTLLIAPVNAYASATNVIAVEYSSVTCLEILEYWKCSRAAIDFSELCHRNLIAASCLIVKVMVELEKWCVATLNNLQFLQSFLGR